MRRDSTVGIATSYMMDGPGIESSWARGYPVPSRPDLVHTQPPIPSHSRGKGA